MLAWCEVRFPAPKVSEVSPSEYFYSDYMKQLRSDMRGGKTTPLINKVCANCINEEKEGRRGLRNYQKNEPLGRVIEVKLRLFGNACNLSCYMCRIKDSSSRIKQTEKLMQIDPKFGEMLEYDKLTDEMKHGGVNYNVTEEYKKIKTPRIEKIYIIGGEPFIMPKHYEVLNALIEIGQAKNIILKYHTNLTKLEWEGNHIFDYIKKFKGCDINWSLEALGEQNDYIRFGSEWESNLENYYNIKKHAKVWANVCASSLSILSLHKTIDWMKSEGLGYSISNIQEPRPCRIDSLHPKIREKLLPMYKGTTIESSLSAEIENWEERWDELLRYLKALDKVNKTDYTKVFPELVM